MSTEKPRITISLDPGVYEVVHRLAKANRRSMSGVVTDVLDLARPQLERMVLVLEAARSVPLASRKEIRAALERAESVVLPILLEAIEQQDLFLAEEAGVGPEDVFQYQAEELPQERASGSGRAAHGAARTVAEGGSTPVPVTRGSGTPKRPGKAKTKGGSRA